MCFGGFGGIGDGNSVSEAVANIFTPDDGASYVGGNLVDDATGASISSGGMTSTDNEISGSANTSRNDIQGPMPAGINFPNSPVKPSGALPSGNQYNRTFSTDQLGALTQVNTPRENIANILTLGDGAKYVKGQLIEEATGRSLTGGGMIKNKAGLNDYIYGVSDDFSNNAPPEQGAMSDDDYRSALDKFDTREDMLEQIPPSNAAYFGSFIPGQAIPVIGSYLGSKMLEGGINQRRAMMDKHQAALDAGATPFYTDDGVYAGYDTDDGKKENYELGGDNTSTQQSMGGDSYYGGDGDSYTGAATTPIGGTAEAANSIYNRYYKGGSGAGLPAWLRRYASGVSINQLLEKVVIEGKEYFKTPDGKYIEPSELSGAVDLGVEQAPA